MKNKYNKYRNNILFPTIYLENEFSGKSNNFKVIKLSSNLKLSKYDIKLFCKDAYYLNINNIHSRIERKKKKYNKRYKNKKVFFFNYI